MMDLYQSLTLASQSVKHQAELQSHKEKIQALENDMKASEPQTGFCMILLAKSRGCIHSN